MRILQKISMMLAPILFVSCMMEPSFQDNKVRASLELPSDEEISALSHGQAVSAFAVTIVPEGECGDEIVEAKPIESQSRKLSYDLEPNCSYYLRVELGAFGEAPVESGEKEDVEETTDSNPMPVSYDTSIAPLMADNCTSCHGAGGISPNLSEYESVKNSADSILDRLKRDPGDGLMPPTAALEDESIEVFQQWMDTGFSLQSLALQDSLDISLLPDPLLYEPVLTQPFGKFQTPGEPGTITIPLGFQ